jgi:hypothetical protein
MGLPAAQQTEPKIFGENRAAKDIARAENRRGSGNDS